MNSKTIVKLLIAFAVLGGIAWFMNREPAGDSADTTGLNTGDLALEDLDANAVASIAITGPDGTNTVAIQDEKWVVDSLHGYPADFDKIRDTLVDWTEIKIGDVPRGGSDEEYGLGADATTVVLNDQDGKALETLSVGEARERKGSQYGGSDGHYIKIGDGPVVLVDGSFDSLPSTSEDWITKDFVNVNSTDITEVSITGTNGTITIDTTDSSKYVVNGLKEKEETNTANAGRAHRALQNLRFSSVADPAKDAAALGLDKAVVYTAKTKDGIVYTLNVGNDLTDGDRYAQLSTEYTAPPAPTREEAEKQVPPEEEKKEGEDAAEDEADAAPEKTREEKVTEKLDELTKAHEKRINDATEKLEALALQKSWVYVLDSLDVEPLMFNRTDLVSAVEEAEEETAADTAPPVPPGIARPPSVTTPPIKVEPPKPKTTVTTPPIKVEAPRKSVTSPPVKIEPPKPEAKEAPPLPPGAEPKPAEKAVDAVKKAAADATEKAKDTGAAAKEAADSATEKAKDAVEEKAKEAVDAAKEAVDSATENAGEKAADAK